ncbi:YbhB/YbcL family Raf kinase inhibitor-like protein [Candidatus Woesearchaeota archaeon]|nr:YbhB/YbcL family Raf kinase inhibitor-like protein [Candidatus Woesearchaeota archaeon]
MEKEIEIRMGKAAVQGTLSIPSKAVGIVLFVHGSGSSRFSPRERFVATQLHKAHLATLIIDLLTPQEEAIDSITAEFRFNISFLAKRLIQTVTWLKKNPLTKHLRIGLFGASTGAAAALIAAAQRPHDITSVVSRGGRPDLAGESLSIIKAPVLLIVGSEDSDVIKLNKQAMARMKCPVQLEIIPYATHLFEEPGTLAQVATLTTQWFLPKLDFSLRDLVSSAIIMTTLLLLASCTQAGTPVMTISSPAFLHASDIPTPYTCQGDDISPPLRISKIPQGTKTLALIVDDPDAPRGTWTHWIVWNIDPFPSIIPEGEIPKEGTQGLNDFGTPTWRGPCPPSGKHRYVFKLYALDTTLELPLNSAKADLENAMKEHTITSAELIGLYQKQ